MSADRTQELQELISRLPLVDSREVNSVVNPEYARWHIALSLTPANLLFAMHRARGARQLGVSHRDFRVGASAVSLKVKDTPEPTPARFQVLAGYNVKPYDSDVVNIHAEQLALQKVRDYGFNAVSMLVVVGETQPDQQTGIESPTLHPCGLCRDFMVQDPLIDSDATMMVSVTPDFRTIEMYSLNDLCDLHDKKRDKLPRLDLPALKMFEPFKPTGEPVRLEDDEQSIEEEHIWNDTVGTYLTQHRLELLGF